MSLIVEIEEIAGSGIWVDLRARHTNSPGTAVTSALPNDSGEAIAGKYTLQFSSVIAGTSATVKVVTSSPDNPYRNLTGRTVNLDNSTVYSDLIGGVDIKFSSSGSFSGLWETEIRVGHSFGSIAGFGTSAGIAGASRRLRARNDETDPDAAPAQNVRARVMKRVKAFPTAGQVFERVFEFAASAVEKITDGQVQPYNITVDNVTGSGSSKTMDLLVDGDLVDVQNVTTPASSTSEGLNVVDVYRIASGDLQDLEFELSEEAEDSSTANILVFGARFTQIAPDLGGAPGDWGTGDVFITADGESAGNIPVGDFGFFHARPLVPDGSISASNPYPLDVLIEAESSSPANWGA